MTEYLSLLQGTALFEGLSRGEIETLCRTLGCRTAYYEKGSVLLRRGERAENAGVVLTGGVRAERNGADGALRILARHGAGALFGDVLSVSRGHGSPIDVVAETDTAVLFVPLAALLGTDAPGCGTAQARMRRNLLAELAEKYWALSRALELLRAPTLCAKLARRLLQERRTQGRDAFLLPGTRETLAAELGANRSALSRELGNMRRAGLLETSRGRFALLDVPALERIADT